MFMSPEMSLVTVTDGLGCASRILQSSSYYRAVLMLPWRRSGNPWHCDPVEEPPAQTWLSPGTLPSSPGG